MAKVRVRLIGLNKLLKRLEELRKKYKADSRVIVGYKSPYALYVHENIEMALEGEPRPSGIGVYWGTPTQPGQAKFLEQPAREMADEIASTITKAMKSGTTFNQALALGGIRLLKASQRLVPVEYGDLKESGFVEVVKR